MRLFNIVMECTLSGPRNSQIRFAEMLKKSLDRGKCNPIDNRSFEWIGHVLIHLGALTKNKLERGHMLFRCNGEFSDSIYKDIGDFLNNTRENFSFRINWMDEIEKSLIRYCLKDFSDLRLDYVSYDYSAGILESTNFHSGKDFYLSIKLPYGIMRKLWESLPYNLSIPSENKDDEIFEENYFLSDGELNHWFSRGWKEAYNPNGEIGNLCDAKKIIYNELVESGFIDSDSDFDNHDKFKFSWEVAYKVPSITNSINIEPLRLVNADMYISGDTRISDPCYSKDNKFSTVIKMVPGKYSLKYEYSNLNDGYLVNRVYLIPNTDDIEGFRKFYSEFEYVSVDSGCLGIFNDDSYPSEGFEYTDSGWGNDSGIIIDGFGGDGCYKVSVHYNDNVSVSDPTYGLVNGIRIDFRN